MRIMDHGSQGQGHAIFCHLSALASFRREAARRRNGAFGCGSGDRRAGQPDESLLEITGSSLPPGLEFAHENQDSRQQEQRAHRQPEHDHPKGATVG